VRSVVKRDFRKDPAREDVGRRAPLMARSLIESSCSGSSTGRSSESMSASAWRSSGSSCLGEGLMWTYTHERPDSQQQLRRCGSKHRYRR
jgi:hypothetical protein